MSALKYSYEDLVGYASLAIDEHFKEHPGEIHKVIGELRKAFPMSLRDALDIVKEARLRRLADLKILIRRG